MSTPLRGFVRIACMDANLAGFVALGALTIGLFAWLRQDIRALRAEMNDKIDGLRAEMNGKIDGLRTEVNGKIDTLRVETNDKIDGLRAEMNDKFDGLRVEMAELRERVARIEGLLEAVFMRRDLTPVPDPPAPQPPGKSEAA